MAVLRNSSAATRRPRHTSNKALLTFLLVLLLTLNYDCHLQKHSVAAWKFRFDRGARGRENRDSDKKEGATRSGRGAEQYANASPADNQRQQEPPPSAAPGAVPPSSDPPPKEDTIAGVSSSSGGGDWFSWVLGLTNTATEAAEETMDDAAELFTEMVDYLKPPPQIVATLERAYAKLKSIVLYKPPVGFVTAFVVSRLILSGRILRIKAREETTVEDEVIGKDKHDTTGRAFVLDRDDTSYSAFGGIERIRRRLCLAAVNGLLQQQSKHNKKVESQLLSSTEEAESSSSSQTLSAVPPLPPPPLTEKQYQYVQSAAKALSVTARPTGSRARLVYQMVEPVAQLEELLAQTNGDGKKRQTQQQRFPFSRAGGGSASGDECGLPSEQVDQLLAVAAMTAKVRATDAVVRLCRDRILQTTYRLARTVEHWERRVMQTRNLKRIFQRLFRNSIEGDRLQLSLAQAAYNAEVERLGEVTALLMERPHGLPESALIVALKATEDGSCRTLGSTALGHRDAFLSSERSHFPPAFRMLSQWTKPLSQYSFRWKADSKGFLSIRRFDADDGFIDVPSAFNALFSGDDTSDWMVEARDWTRKARKIVCVVVRGCLKGSTSDSLKVLSSDFQELDNQWCSVDDGAASDQPDAATIEKQWRSVIKYVDSTSSWRRIGEGQKIRIRDAFRFIDWTKNWDVLGIPSALLKIYCGILVHERFVKPHWATVRRELSVVLTKAVEIVQTRALEPMKDIYEDIMNKSPSMMSALGLEIEETSLDHMLRDMGLGDGTPATRNEALRKAMEQYEKDISGSLVANLIVGRLVGLMLLQIQQLKVGLLSALDTIDVLIKGNRIYFKVLASIPAIVIATYGTRYTMRSLYNFRAKDIRPVTVVHSEMSQYLTKMENLLLLSDQVELSDRGDSLARNTTSADESAQRAWATLLKPTELGELILNMHRYLILLDFSSPPFSNRNCDEIHNSLQQFLGTGGTLKRLNSDRQIQWLNRIRQKHQDLVKSI